MYIRIYTCTSMQVSAIMCNSDDEDECNVRSCCQWCRYVCIHVCMYVCLCMVRSLTDYDVQMHICSTRTYAYVFLLCVYTYKHKRIYTYCTGRPSLRTVLAHPCMYVCMYVSIHVYTYNTYTNAVSRVQFSIHTLHACLYVCMYV
jgi:hypothetical protein